MSDRVVIHALYRASLTAVKSLKGRPLPLQPSIKGSDWGKFQRLTEQQLDAERSAVFPWASASDASSFGVIEANALLRLVRRRFRDSTKDVDAAINDGFAALRNFGELFEQLETSSTATTNGVRVHAVSKFLGVSDESGTHVFAYRIRIANTDRNVQLRSRHWIIEDERGGSVVVPKGSPGVVGQTPRLVKGAQFEYVSGTELAAPRGFIKGSFEFVTDDGQTFDALVGPFSLVAPDRTH
ncbi:hypothetical protein CTAYLR_003053 [Chrysophaeum taylorii]|uniref:ApaG domain-containing protein n=1 Tax=Chrysophaeum taylorii TaxID=2483200 RepID=A0AAD7U7I2_9STRA|nr:hypothetical protein CTAYLR_003053 [Chrysophaeum taylorii]